MTPKERVLNRLCGKPVDKIPNFSIVMQFAAKHIGATMDKYCSDYRTLVQANIETARAFGLDIMHTMSDPVRETADYGAKVVFEHDRIPRAVEHFIQTPADVSKLKPLKPYETVRMLDRIKAVELYKKELGDDYPVMGWVEGMGAEAGDLMGVSELMIAFYDQPEMVRDVMDVCFESAKACIKAQVDAGADIIGVGDALASVAGPIMYKEFILPYEKKLFAYIKECGAIGRLHICGDITRILDDIATCGAQIVDVDFMADFQTAVSKLGPDIAANGNFDPVEVVLQGTPETIRQAVESCVNAGNERTFIMPGCEVPPNTSHENMLAMHQTLVDIGG